MMHSPPTTATESTRSTFGRRRVVAVALAVLALLVGGAIVLLLVGVNEEAAAELRNDFFLFSESSSSQQQDTKTELDGGGTPLHNNEDSKKRRRRGHYHHTVLCYGDSLTAGVSGRGVYYPYATYLQEALQQQYNASSKGEDTATTTTTRTIRVDYRGMPGWTTAQMLQRANDPETGLVSALQQQKHHYSLVIILAGTNDLGHRVPVDQIVRNLEQLHRMALRGGDGGGGGGEEEEDNDENRKKAAKRTLAIAIPPSGYQSRNPQAAEAARNVNAQLRDWCNNNTSTTTTFVPFPFSWEPPRDDDDDGDEDYWYQDQLHFTQRGYQVLGQRLAPIVAKIFEDLEEQEEDE